MIRHIVVVGGGTAGWIAANLLHLRLIESVRRRRPLGASAPLRITVVASSRLGPIGVGESTTPIFTGLLRQLGIDEAELIREVGATYKLGIEFENWRGDGTAYRNPFGAPEQIPTTDPPEFQYAAAWLVAQGRPLADGLLPHPSFMAADKSPFLPDGRDLSDGRGAYALHVDAGRLAAYLQQRAIGLGVAYLDARVCAVERNPDSGFIEALRLEEGERVAGDFFLDCTGSRRLLIGDGLGAAWESYADDLPLDSALLMPKTEQSDDPVHPYTRARAAPHGWIWEIPVQGRIGRGYVFQSALVTPEEAAVEAQALLGETVVAGPCLRFAPGAVVEPWTGNCVAVGLSAGFVEPLEATAIHAIIVQLYALTAVLTPGLDLRSNVSRPYNREMRRFNRAVRDYLVLHYLGGREDTRFWRQFSGERRRLPGDLAEKLRLWQARLPIEGDLDGTWRLFGALQWMFVLQGVGRISSQLAARELADRALGERARRVCQRMAASHQEKAAAAVDHRSLLESARSTPGPGR